MNKWIALGAILIFTGLILFSYHVSIRGGTNNIITLIQVGNVVSPAMSLPITEPSPTPIIIDQNSNLEEEVRKLTPQNFSSELKSLREEADNF